MIPFFKSRCLICWKGFEVPLPPHGPGKLYLYCDKSAREFSCFNRFDNQEIENVIIEWLSKKPDLQFLNDETKGTTALDIAGLLANGNQECVSGYHRCPRCGLKFNLVSNTKACIKEIRQLTFTNFLQLDSKGRQQYLTDKTKAWLK